MSYFLQISENIERFDYRNLSKKQQEDFEYFLDTAIVDSWTFGTGEIEIVNFPNFENKNSDALSAFGDLITQHQNNISSYDEQINALPSLDDIQKTVDDAVKEYRELQNSTPRTAEAVQNRQERLSYLKEFR